MPQFFARKAYPNPYAIDDPVYEILISPPPGGRQRDTRIAHISPNFPNTYLGKQAATQYRPVDKVVYVSIRLEDDGDDFAPIYQTDSLSFITTVAQLHDDDHMVLGWKTLLKYFDDHGEAQGVRTLVLKPEVSYGCWPY